MLKDRKTHSTILIILVVLLPAVLGLLGVIRAQDNVVNFLTHHLNNARTGWNDQERKLTPTNVGNLHKLWVNNEINGQIYGAPLYYNLGGQELLFLVTQNNWLYILDAATGDQLFGSQISDGEPPLTQFEFEAKLRGGCGDIQPLHGITSTPVIDDRTNTLYLVDLTKEDGMQVYKAHAIDIVDTLGSKEITDLPGWPVTIRGNFQGVEFEAWYQTQRGALTLVKEKGMLYVPFSSRCDAYDWHGWIFGLDITDPTKTPFVFNTSPDGNGAGIWGPGGMSLDEDGAGYFVTGNGTVNFPVTGIGRSFSMSVLRIDPFNPVEPFSRDRQDFFTISDFGPANARDTDLGGSSALVVPEQSGTTTPRLLFTAGKDGRVYLMNRDNMGGLAGELQRMRAHAGSRVAPSYYEDGAGGHFVYVCASDENQFPAEGTHLDWEDGPINMTPEIPPGIQQQAVGTGPALIEFQDQLFVAWINNTDEREVLIKSSPNGSNWSSEPIAVEGANAAARASAALAVFQNRLYLSWIDDETHRIMVKSSEDGVDWSGDAQALDQVPDSTYTSMAVLNGGALYLAFISNSTTHDILLKSTSDGDFRGSSNIPINANQVIPVSAPFIIEFNNRLYAFWLRHRDNRDIVFKASAAGNGQSWPTGDPTRLSESADQRSGLSGLVLNTIGDDQNPPAPRLFVFFLTNERARRIFSKSIDRFGTVEGSFNNPIFYFRTYESGTGGKVGAAVFRGRPHFAFASNNFERRLLLKRGDAAYKGRGLTAFRLTVDEAGRSRFNPAWTSPAHYDYLPGSAFVTSDGGRNGIVWVTEGGVKFLPPTLHAYDAVTGEEIFNSNNTGDTNDRIDPANRNNTGRKFVQTVVVNGRVYLTSGGNSTTGAVHAYGLKAID